MLNGSLVCIKILSPFADQPSAEAVSTEHFSTDGAVWEYEEVSNIVIGSCVLQEE